jgi:hypothetical protein
MGKMRSQDFDLERLEKDERAMRGWCGNLLALCLKPDLYREGGKPW